MSVESRVKLNSMSGKKCRGGYFYRGVHECTEEYRRVKTSRRESIGYKRVKRSGGIKRSVAMYSGVQNLLEIFI